jgi:hypothetical protein
MSATRGARRLDQCVRTCPLCLTRSSCVASPVGPTSKYRGVYWHQRHVRWEAVIAIEQQRRHLGAFTSEEAAARAYDR